MAFSSKIIFDGLKIIKINKNLTWGPKIGFSIANKSKSEFKNI